MVVRIRLLFTVYCLLFFGAGYFKLLAAHLNG